MPKLLFKLLPPETSNPNELIKFKCSICDTEVTSSQMGTHAEIKHKIKYFHVDSTMTSPKWEKD